MKALLNLLNFRDQSTKYNGWPHYGPKRIERTVYPFGWQTHRTAQRDGMRATMWMRVVKAGRMYKGSVEDYAR